ncbi:MAG TPA: cytochrome P450, partial [Myxococcota bacterium]|nr:cytochrome P450 [Myxococcota bacterium]
MRQPARQAIPSPPGQFLFGNLRQMQRAGMLNYYVDAWKRYGDTIRFKMGPLSQFLFIKPEHVRHVMMTNADNYSKGIGFKKLKMLAGEGLLTSDNPIWKRQRRLMQPPFTAKAVTKFLKPMADSVDGLMGRWHGMAKAGTTLDIGQEMMRLAMDIIGRTMLSRSLDEEADALGPAITAALHYINDRTVTLVDMPLFVPTAENVKFRRAQAVIDTFIGDLIAARRANNDKDDLLSLLIDARDDEDKTGMTDQQLRNEIFTVYLAGHETTAQLLTWTWYLLSQHPEVERNLHAEVDAVLGGRFPTMEDTRKLSYTFSVIQESMRLYPPVWMMPRDAIQDDEIDGVHVPARSMVIVSPYLTQRHPDYWAEPLAFQPERFAPDAGRGRLSCSFFPFGAGPRTCLGIHFATLEATLILAMVSQTYRLSLTPGCQVQEVAEA